MIRFRALILVAVIYLFQVHCLLADAGEDKIENVLITPFIGDYLWLAEAYLISEGPFGSYLGAVTDSDVFGGFADADGDGLEDLLIVVDHDITCERTLCDFLVFAPVVEDRQLNAACDWRLVDDRRRNIVRGLYERFAIVGDIAVPLTRLPFGDAVHTQRQRLARLSSFDLRQRPLHQIGKATSRRFERPSPWRL